MNENKFIMGIRHNGYVTLDWKKLSSEAQELIVHTAEKQNLNIKIVENEQLYFFSEDFRDLHFWLFNLSFHISAIII